MNQNERLYSIGEMAKLSGVSIKALRYYDEKGLLKPSNIDPQTGYRYYEKQQILAVMIIKEYKSLNFSLAEIKSANNGELNQLLQKLNDKLDETNSKIKKLTYVRQRLTKYIQGFSHESILKHSKKSKYDYSFCLQYIPKSKVVYSRYRCVHTPSMLLERYRQLNVIMEENNLYKIGPLMGIFHDKYQQYDYSNADIEVCCEIVGDNKNLSCVRDFGGFWALRGLHRGPYETLINIYTSSLKWLQEKSYEYLGGGAVERYIVDAMSSNDTSKYVTEIILPVKNILDSPLGLDFKVE